jgi:hypothetical protein
MKIVTHLFIASALSFALFSACSKDDTGTAGPAGQNGSNGTNGNANVKPTKDSVTASSGWTFNGSSWYAVFVNPYLANIINSGGFAEVFISTSGGTVWSAFPAPYGDSTLNAQWSYSYTETTVSVSFTWSDQQKHTDPYATYASTAYFNVVAIAPGLAVKYPQTNWNSYSEVMAIPEVKHN